MKGYRFDKRLCFKNSLARRSNITAERFLGHYRFIPDSELPKKHLTNISILCCIYFQTILCSAVHKDRGARGPRWGQKSTLQLCDTWKQVPREVREDLEKTNIIWWKSSGSFKTVSEWLGCKKFTHGRSQLWRPLKVSFFFSGTEAKNCSLRRIREPTQRRWIVRTSSLGSLDRGSDSSLGTLTFSMEAPSKYDGMEAVIDNLRFKFLWDFNPSFLTSTI